MRLSLFGIFVIKKDFVESSIETNKNNIYASVLTLC